MGRHHRSEGGGKLGRREFLKVTAAMGGALRWAIPKAFGPRSRKGFPLPPEAWEAYIFHWEGQ